jgi:hypothetical protein
MEINPRVGLRAVVRASRDGRAAAAAPADDKSILDSLTDDVKDLEREAGCARPGAA